MGISDPEHLPCKQSPSGCPDLNAPTGIVGRAAKASETCGEQIMQVTSMLRSLHGRNDCFPIVDETSACSFLLCGCLGLCIACEASKLGLMLRVEALQ